MTPLRSIDPMSVNVAALGNMTTRSGAVTCTSADVTIPRVSPAAPSHAPVSKVRGDLLATASSHTAAFGCTHASPQETRATLDREISIVGPPQLPRFGNTDGGPAMTTLPL